MTNTETTQTVNRVKSNIFPLLKRASILIEDGDFENAEAYCERVLEIDPENGTAYLGKLMAKKRLKRRKDFANLPEPFDEDNDYKRFVRYGNAQIISELKGYIAIIKDRVEEERRKAEQAVKKKRRNLYLILSAIATVIIISLCYIVMMRVAENRQLEVIKKLYNIGSDVNAKTNDGWTALMLAARGGHAEHIKVLLNAGADVNAEDYRGVTALMWAASGGHAEAIKLLLNAGADVNAKNNIFGVTALMMAAGGGHAEVIKLLLNAGADVNAKSNEGYTALMAAAQEGHAEAIQLLLDAGADVNIRDYYGKRAVDYARRNSELKGTDALRLLEQLSR